MNFSENMEVLEVNTQIILKCRAEKNFLSVRKSRKAVNVQVHISIKNYGFSDMFV